MSHRDKQITRFIIIIKIVQRVQHKKDTYYIGKMMMMMTMMMMMMV